MAGVYQEGLEAFRCGNTFRFARTYRIAILLIFTNCTVETLNATVEESDAARDLFGATTRQRGVEMSKVRDLHKKWSRDSDYRKIFDELKPEFDLACSRIEVCRRHVTLMRKAWPPAQGITGAK